MTPAEQAKAVLGPEWLEALEAHLLNGYVISTPDAFVMARIVPHGAEITDPWQTWPDGDAWFVWVGVGTPAVLLAMAPRPLPWVGWYRQRRNWQSIKWVSTNRLRAKLGLHFYGYGVKSPHDGQFAETT